MVRLIDGLKFMEQMCEYCNKIAGEEEPCKNRCCAIKGVLFNQAYIDTDAMPEGRPGYYIEWDIGMGDTRFYRIRGICIYDDYVRYDIGEMLCPVVNHKAIVRILTPEEMEKEVRNVFRAERRGNDEVLPHDCTIPG